MDATTVRRWIEEYGEVSFSRSSGPGGQNVNKVSTKSLLRIRVAAVEGVTEDERVRILTKLSGRLTGDGELVIQVQDERSQLLNRELAVERMLHILVTALHRDKPRRKTKPTRASKEKRLSAKRVTSETKRNRARPED